MGGAALFLNPEPLAPFADLIAAGEGEALVPRLLDALVGSADPRKGIESLQPKDGFYVPSRYEVRYHDDGTVLAYDGPGAVVRQRGWPGKMPMPQSAILTPNTEMSMKFMVEISRGCPCMCRFCWAGYNYLPVRGFSRAEIVARAREVRAVTSKHRPRVDRGLRPPRDRRHRGRPGRDGLRGLGGLAAPGRPDARLRAQAGGHRRAGPDAGTRVRIGPHAPHPQQAVQQRRDPGEGGVDLQQRDPEPEALLHGRAALGRALGRRGDRGPDRAHPRHDDPDRPQPGPRGPHPPVREPLRAQAGHALPVAAHGGPEGDRPQAAVPAQGLRAHAERGRHLQERAHGRLAVDPGAGRPTRGRRAGVRGRATTWT